MRKVFLMIFILLALFVTAGTAAEDYKLGPHDVISIKVWDEEDLSGDFEVNSNGDLVINWLDPIPVKGLQLDEVRDKILNLLKTKYIRKPKITLISIKEYSSNKVSIMGEVNKPGDYRISDSSTMLDVVLKAGGPSTNASNSLVLLRKVKMKEAEGEKESESFEKKTFNLHNLMTRKKDLANINLANSDVIYIPSSKGISDSGSVDTGITVMGAVKKMGVFQYKEGYTAMGAIIDAGGFTKFAKKNRTLLVRGKGKNRKNYVLKMGDVMDKGHKKKDVPLKPGDIIIAREGFL